MNKFLLKDALEKGYAVGAFNFGSLEILKSIISAATLQNTPVIAQISESALEFMGKKYLKKIIKVARRNAQIPISFHFDHGKSFESVKTAIKMGCDSVMIDASMLPFEDNIAITKRVVDYAHKKGVYVEAELGSLAGIEDDIKVEDKNSCYTDPMQAQEFVKRTNVDSLAIAIGTKHGAYKFSGSAKLRFDILEQIEQAIPNTPLVLHGASGVDEEDVKKLLDLGVDITGARGVSEDILRKVSKTNICKINGDTDIRISYLLGILSHIRANKTNIDYRQYLGAGMAEVTKLVVKKFDIYGSVNMANND